MSPDREQYERDLAERQRRHLDSVHETIGGWQPCLHDACPRCHGTGVTRHGPCVHMISCPCPKCRPCSMGVTP